MGLIAYAFVLNIAMKPEDNTKNKRPVINLLFPAQSPCADLVKKKTRFLLPQFLLCW